MKTSVPRKLVKNYTPRKHQSVHRVLVWYRIFTPVDPSRTLHVSDGSFGEPGKKTRAYLARIKPRPEPGPSTRTTIRGAAHKRAEPGADFPSKKERFPSGEGRAAAAAAAASEERGGDGERRQLLGARRGRSRRRRRGRRGSR
jgi:hypothetical protein